MENAVIPEEKVTFDKDIVFTNFTRKKMKIGNRNLIKK